jgi:hypothetical protein
VFIGFLDTRSAKFRRVRLHIYSTASGQHARTPIERDQARARIAISRNGEVPHLPHFLNYHQVDGAQRSERPAARAKRREDLPHFLKTVPQLTPRN